MENIIYLDDYINFYNVKLNKVLVIKPYKNTLKDGKIIDKDKFIKYFNKILVQYKLKNNIFTSSIHIIISNNYYNEDKRLITNIFEELNYKNIYFISEVNYLNLNKNNLYINYNNSYFYIYFVNDYGKVNIDLYPVNEITNKLLIDIINEYNKNNIIIYGKNYLNISKILNKSNLNFYYYEESDNLIIKILLSKI